MANSSLLPDKADVALVLASGTSGVDLKPHNMLLITGCQVPQHERMFGEFARWKMSAAVDALLGPSGMTQHFVTADGEADGCLHQGCCICCPGLPGQASVSQLL